MSIDASQVHFPSPRRRGASRRRRRLALFAAAGLVLAAATALVLSAFDSSIVFFRTPSEVAQQRLAPGARLRLGGLVKAGSVAHDGATVRFVVTDMTADLPVTFTGLLPDLFREGQGVVAEGALGDAGVFLADNVLAKHDETYMPKDVADRMKAQGVWKGGEAAAPGPVK